MYSHYTLEKWFASQQFWRRIMLFYLCIFGTGFFWIPLLSISVSIYWIQGVVLFLILLYLLVDYFYFRRELKKMIHYNIEHYELWVAFYEKQLSLLKNFQERKLDPEGVEYRYFKEQLPDYFVQQKIDLETRYRELQQEKEYYQNFLKKIGRI